MISKEPNETAILRKKVAEKLTQVGDIEDAYYATASYYESLADAAEKPEEKAELYKKAVEEFTKTGDAKQAHNANAWYYESLADAIEKPEERAELYKKAAKESTNAGNAEEAHYFTAWYYAWLALTTEQPKEKAELHKKAAKEFTNAGNAEEAHYFTAWYYESLADAAEKSEEKAELYKKAAEKLKEAGRKEDAHELMAKHYFFLSLCAKSKAESERYQILASGETKLGWLYLVQIAFKESKKSKIINTLLLELTIELYKKYLQYKNRKFPVSSVYLCGDVTDSTKKIIPNMSEYFKFNVTSFPRGRFKNTPKFKEEVKNNDFVLMELNKDIGNELLYELGLVSGMEKPIIIFISKNINSLNRFIPKVATVISNLKHAFTALKLFSVIKSGESLAIRDKTEKSAIDELIHGFKERPLFISQFELDKTGLIGRYRGKS